MEHQVLVPLPARLVRQALRDPGLPARCVPGLTVDRPAEEGPSGDGPVAARLRLRVGGATITYRGAFTATAALDGGPDGGPDGAALSVTALSVTAEGHEARGSGGLSAALRITVREEHPDAGTSWLVVTGEVTAKGRLAELDGPAVAAAGRRLLDRFAVALAEDAAALEQPGEAAGAAAGAPSEEAGSADGLEELEEELRDAEAEALDAFPELAAEGLEVEGLEAEGLEVEDLDDIDVPGEGDGDGEPDQGETVDADLDALEATRMLEAEPVDGAPADASDLLDGPVRRSIVGRSAEEVDHAPPRGRYAPALPARSARARAAVRWTGAERGPATPVATPEAGRSVLPWVIGGGVALLGGAVALARALRRH